MGMVACTTRDDNSAVSESRVVELLTDAYFSFLVLPPQAIADLLKTKTRALRGGDHFCDICAVGACLVSNCADKVSCRATSNINCLRFFGGRGYLSVFLGRENIVKGAHAAVG